MNDITLFGTIFKNYILSELSKSQKDVEDNSERSFGYREGLFKAVKIIDKVIENETDRS